jgi:hypothetical protein
MRLKYRGVFLNEMSDFFVHIATSMTHSPVNLGFDPEQIAKVFILVHTKSPRKSR